MHISCTRFYIDRPDDTCRVILSNAIPAMCNGYGKILIHGNVIPDTNVHWEVTKIDLVLILALSRRSVSGATCLSRLALRLLRFRQLKQEWSL